MASPGRSHQNYASGLVDGTDLAQLLRGKMDDLEGITLELGSGGHGR